MKNAVPDIIRNKFRGEAYTLGTFMGTPHGNGGSPISTKENRRSCSCVPNLSYISKEEGIKSNKHAIPAFAHVKDFSGLRTQEVSMREKTIEAKLVQAVRTKGGLAPKFTSPGLDGVPDRLVLLPGGRIAFIELKAPGKTLRPLQVRRKRQLEALGFSVYCIDSPEQIGGILSEIQGA